MKKVKNISLRKLHTEEDYDFLSDVKKATETLPITGTPGIEDIPEANTTLLTSCVNNFSDCVNKFDLALKETLSVPENENVANADLERDAAWRGANNYLKAMLVHPEESIAAKAKAVKRLFDKYGDPTSISQREESGILSNLIQDLNTITEEDMKALAFSPWFDNLDYTATRFKEEYEYRSKVQSTYSTGIVKQSRNDADDAYRELIDMVNIFTRVSGEKHFASFIDLINDYIDKIQTIVKTRETNNAKKRAEENADSLLDPEAK